MRLVECLSQDTDSSTAGRRRGNVNKNNGLERAYDDVPAGANRPDEWQRLGKCPPPRTHSIVHTHYSIQ